MKNIILILCVLLAFVGVVGIVGGLGKDSASSSASTETGSSIQSEVDFSNKSYVAFGDSITYGADYTRSYAQMDNSYPELVASSLKMQDYSNLGQSGSTLVSNVPNRGCISSIVSSYTGDGDVISVMGGVNDYAVSTPLGSINDTTAESIYGALDMIASTLKEKCPNSFVFFMTPYKCILSGNSCMTDNSQGYNLQDVANAVKLVANKYDIPVLDMFACGKYEVKEMCTTGSDGLHPSQSFVTKYTAPQIAKFIHDNYRK